MSDNEDRIRMELLPIGTVRNRIKQPIGSTGTGDIDPEVQKERIRAYHREIINSVSEIVIDPGLTDLLDGIEGFSHILVLFWPHLNAPERRRVRKVHPMRRKDIPEQGVFATRSPARPNPVLISVVKLIAREKNVLRVNGLDAVDGSPVIDIKPYRGRYEGAEEATIPDWMRQLHEELEKDGD